MTGTGGNPLNPGVKYQYLTAIVIVIPGITYSSLLWGCDLQSAARKANLVRGCACAIPESLRTSVCGCPAPVI